MPKHMKYFLTLAGVIIIGSFLAFLYNCIAGLADFAGSFEPALTPWVFWILLGSVTVMLGWMGAMAFFRPKPMMVYADPTDEDRAKFNAELLRRLRKNPYLRETGIEVTGETDMGIGLTALRDKADAEIKSTAKRVFIGTAISQNGRLDTLVVLYLITRLTWRIAKLYNQRPHYRELINLYANIAATSFLAGSIEEFGIEDYVRELMGPLVSGSAIGAVPGAQAIASTITASILTGSTNCLLALRCGIVARDYVSLDLDTKGAMRRSATIEASKRFVTMSAETVTYVTRLLVKGSAGAVKTGTSKVARGVGSTLTGAAEGVGTGARKVGQGVKNTAESVGDGARKVGQGIKDTAEVVGDSAKRVGKSVKDSVETAGQNVKDTVGTIGENAKKAGQHVKDTTESVTRKVAHGVDDTLGKGKAKGAELTRKLSEKAETIKDAGLKAVGKAQALKDAGLEASHQLDKLRSKGSDAVNKLKGRFFRRDRK